MRHSADVRFIEGNRAMTASELEAMVRNLNIRTTAMEQILQTLATNDPRPLFENLTSRFEILAEHLANLPTDIMRLTAQGAELRSDIQRLTDQVAVIPELRRGVER